MRDLMIHGGETGELPFPRLERFAVEFLLR
jgi:hypothetical protein